MLSESSSVNSGEVKSEQTEPATSSNNSQRMNDWDQILEFGQPADNDTRSAPDVTDSADPQFEPPVPPKRPRIQAPDYSNLLHKADDAMQRFLQPSETPGTIALWTGFC